MLPCRWNLYSIIYSLSRAVFLGPDAKTASQSNPSSDHGIWVEEYTEQGIFGTGLKKNFWNIRESH